MRRRWVVLGAVAFLIVWLGGTWAVAEWRDDSAETEATATRCAAALNALSNFAPGNAIAITWVNTAIRIVNEDCPPTYTPGPTPTPSN
jgi:hypothetical protein